MSLAKHSVAGGSASATWARSLVHRRLPVTRFWNWARFGAGEAVKVHPHRTVRRRANKRSTRLTRFVLAIAAIIAADGFLCSVHAQCPREARIFIDPRLVPQRPQFSRDQMIRILASDYIRSQDK